MKSTGIVRKLDQLGRVVLPKELRRTLELDKGDPVEIFTDQDQIILSKYQPKKECVVTRKISDDNARIGNTELFVSPEGAEQLIEELETFVQKERR